MWRELVAVYAAVVVGERNAKVLGGFIFEANQRDRSFSTCTLDAAIRNPDLLPILPYLHARLGLDAEGLARLGRAAAEGDIVASSFHSIANNSVSMSPPVPLAALLKEIAALPQGVEIALKILRMHFFCREQKEGGDHSACLISVGRDLLARLDFNKDSSLDDYDAHTVIQSCLVGEDGRGAAKKVCANFRSALESYHVSSHNLSYTLKALFEMQPFVALDTFLLPTVTHRNGYLFEEGFGTKSPIESLGTSMLQEWASRDPGTRYPLLGECLRMFPSNGDQETDISPLFVSILEQAPDKRLFLGDFWDRLLPGGWSGSLADILIRRKAQVMKLAELADEQVRVWVADTVSKLDRWIDDERGRDRAREESFE